MIPVLNGSFNYVRHSLCPRLRRNPSTPPALSTLTNPNAISLPCCSLELARGLLLRTSPLDGTPPHQAITQHPRVWLLPSLNYLSSDRCSAMPDFRSTLPIAAPNIRLGDRKACRQLCRNGSAVQPIGTTERPCQQR